MTNIQVGKNGSKATRGFGMGAKRPSVIKRPSAATPNAYLLESGDNLLLEADSSNLLLEG